MSDFQIIKNAPMPKLRSASCRYPFAKMESGDAFDVSLSIKGKVAAAASIFGKRNGMKFSVLKVGEETARVFRTA